MLLTHVIQRLCFDVEDLGQMEALLEVVEVSLQLAAQGTTSPGLHVLIVSCRPSLH